MSDVIERREPGKDYTDENGVRWRQCRGTCGDGVNGAWYPLTTFPVHKGRHRGGKQEYRYYCWPCKRKRERERYHAKRKFENQRPNLIDDTELAAKARAAAWKEAMERRGSAARAASERSLGTKHDSGLKYYDYRKREIRREVREDGHTYRVFEWRAKLL